MSKKKEPQYELKPKEVRMLSDYATQTRFTWAVILLAFITGLIGMLSIAKQYSSNSACLLTAFLFFVYAVLDLGLSFSFYKMCYTSYLIDVLRQYQSPAVMRFVDKYWSYRYRGVYVVERNNEPGFRRWAVVLLVALMWIVWMTLLILIFVHA